MTLFANLRVEEKFNTYPKQVKPKLLALRALIFRTAAETSGVGDIEETLKWGEPAYRTKNGSGSTVRIDWKKKTPDQYAMYFHCQTNLVESFRTHFPDDFQFQGNRALIFALEDNIPEDSLALCIAAALTYHQSRR